MSMQKVISQIKVFPFFLRIISQQIYFSIYMFSKLSICSDMACHPIYHNWVPILVPYLWVTATHLQYINMGIEITYAIYIIWIHPWLQPYIYIYIFISYIQFPAGFQSMWSNLSTELGAHRVLIKPNTGLYHSPILASLTTISPYCWFPWALFMIDLIIQSNLFITCTSSLNAHKRHSISRPWGWKVWAIYYGVSSWVQIPIDILLHWQDIEYPLEVQIVFCISHLSIHVMLCPMQCHIMINLVIRRVDSINYLIAIWPVLYHAKHFL